MCFGSYVIESGSVSAEKIVSDRQPTITAAMQQ
jgi:hypothetical protein